MNNKAKNVVIILLLVIIIGSLGLGFYNISQGKKDAGEPNPNVTIVAAPEQTDFEEHPEWVIPEPEVVDHGENLALGKKVWQSSQTQVYNCRNVVDDNRYTYWEGAPDEYPGFITIDLEEVTDLSGVEVMLSPNQIWGARTQEIEILVSDDNEDFVPAAETAEYDFDPLTNGNAVYIPLDSGARGQYLRVCFYSNTGATNGQAAEVAVYGVLPDGQVRD